MRTWAAITPKARTRGGKGSPPRRSANRATTTRRAPTKFTRMSDAEIAALGVSFPGGPEVFLATFKRSYPNGWHGPRVRSIAELLHTIVMYDCLMPDPNSTRH